jgi:diguanylate cyclase (GGDEF)-like protein
VILLWNAGIVLVAINYLTNFELENKLDFVLIPEASISAVSEITFQDHLTGLSDKGIFQTEIRAEIKRFSRYRNDGSRILIDIDNFKELNDLHRHIARDQLLSKIGRLLQDVVRDVEVIAHVGGEKFAILLPQTEFSEAHVSAKRIRKAIDDEFNIDHQVTVSIGAANCPRNACSMHDLIL